MGILIFTLANKTKKINKTEDWKFLKEATEISVHLRYLYQDKGLRGKELLKRYPQYSKATIYSHPCYQTGSSTPTSKGPTV